MPTAGMQPYHVKRMQYFWHGDFAQRLEYCSWLTGNLRLHCFNLSADGQMKIVRPLWTVAPNNVSVSLCGVQVWMISWLLPLSSKVVLDERCTYDFCRRN